MTAFSVRQRPIRLRGSGKYDVRTQFGALPWRIRGGEVEVLLVTSRGTGRWIIPKGWPVHKETPAKAAAIEAFEEGGVTGTASDVALGFYSYRKALSKKDNLPIVVAVFPVQVTEVLDDWPERKERRRKWVNQRKAAQMLAEPELRQIVRDFDPRALDA